MALFGVPVGPRRRRALAFYRSVDTARYIHEADGAVRCFRVKALEPLTPAI
jgi:hypothetical protein